VDHELLARIENRILKAQSKGRLKLHGRADGGRQHRPAHGRKAASEVISPLLANLFLH
jgi:hypothetical protein